MKDPIYHPNPITKKVGYLYIYSIIWFYLFISDSIWDTNYGSTAVARKHVWPKTISANPALTPTLTLTLTLSLIHNNIFGLTKWRHFSRKYTDTTNMVDCFHQLMQQAFIPYLQRCIWFGVPRIWSIDFLYTRPLKLCVALYGLNLHNFQENNKELYKTNKMTKFFCSHRLNKFDSTY